MVITDNIYVEVNNDYENALRTMHKMPKIWLGYCNFLISQKKITMTRRTFDRALQALPLTQHDLIWDPYIAFIKSCGVPETAACVYRRFILVEPEAIEDFIHYLIETEHYDEAVKQLCRLFNEDRYKNIEKEKRGELLSSLLNLLIKHPRDILSVNVEQMIRNCIREFEGEQGMWWCMYAEYFQRLNNVEKARDV